jgi:sugar phosphate isomerase/epimerase
MKLAVVVADAAAPPSAFVVWRGIEESIIKAAACGYQGVELALKLAEDVAPRLLERWLGRANMEVSCISTGQVFASLNLYFTNPDPEARERAVSVFRGLIDLASDFGRLINIGRVRGFIGPEQTREEAEALFTDMIRRLGDEAAGKGVQIIVEPVNRYEINFINSVAEGAALIARVGWPNIGLMPDVFHMNIEDVRIGETLAEYGPLVRYIHLADSNRRAPGQGHLDFDDVFIGLKRSGFDGWAAVEILPFPDPDTAARQAADYLLPRLASYNAAG